MACIANERIFTTRLVVQTCRTRITQLIALCTEVTVKHIPVGIIQRLISIGISKLVVLSYRRAQPQVPRPYNFLRCIAFTIVICIFVKSHHNVTTQTRSCLSKLNLHNSICTRKSNISNNLFNNLLIIGYTTCLDSIERRTRSPQPIEFKFIASNQFSRIKTQLVNCKVRVSHIIILTRILTVTGHAYIKCIETRTLENVAVRVALRVKVSIRLNGIAHLKVDSVVITTLHTTCSYDCCNVVVTNTSIYLNNSSRLIVLVTSCSNLQTVNRIRKLRCVNNREYRNASSTTQRRHTTTISRRLERSLNCTSTNTIKFIYNILRRIGKVAFIVVIRQLIVTSQRYRVRILTISKRTRLNNNMRQTMLTVSKISTLCTIAISRLLTNYVKLQVCVCMIQIKNTNCTLAIYQIVCNTVMRHCITRRVIIVIQSSVVRRLQLLVRQTESTQTILQQSSSRTTYVSQQRSIIRIVHKQVIIGNIRACLNHTTKCCTILIIHYHIDISLVIRSFCSRIKRKNTNLIALIPVMSNR